MLTRSGAAFLTSVIVVALEPMSWLTSRIPPCIVNPDQYGSSYANNQQCPAFHVFFGHYVAVVLDKLGDPAWATVAATIVIAIFTATLGWSTHKLWSSSERQLVINSRAWVFVGVMNGTGKIVVFDNKIRFKFYMANSGRSPALITQFWYRTAAAAPLSNAPDRTGGAVYQHAFVLGAGEHYPHPHEMFEASIDEPFVMGCIDYVDVFRKTQRSWFCLKLLPNEGRAEVAGSAAWNDFGGNDP